jgi:hypothetical protein
MAIPAISWLHDAIFQSATGHQLRRLVDAIGARRAIACCPDPPPPRGDRRRFHRVAGPVWRSAPRSLSKVNCIDWPLEIVIRCLERTADPEHQQTADPIQQHWHRTQPTQADHAGHAGHAGEQDKQATKSQSQKTIWQKVRPAEPMPMSQAACVCFSLFPNMVRPPLRVQWPRLVLACQQLRQLGGIAGNPSPPLRRDAYFVPQRQSSHAFVNDRTKFRASLSGIAVARS